MKIRVIRTPAALSKLRTGLIVTIVGISLITAGVISIDQVRNVFAANNKEEKATTVIIDPGHGGVDGGAVGYSSIIEKDINLSISLKLRTLFEVSGFNVVMTREDDRSIHDKDSKTIREKKVTDLHNRSKLLEKYPDAIFLSIHQNMYTELKYSGTQVFYSKNNEDSKILASLIQSNVKELLQPENDRVIKSAGKDLYILYHAKIPAVLVECGFLSNPEEAQKLNSSEYQYKMAFAIYCGTLDYCS